MKYAPVHLSQNMSQITFDMPLPSPLPSSFYPTPTPTGGLFCGIQVVPGASGQLELVAINTCSGSDPTQQFTLMWTDAVAAPQGISVSEL